MMGAAGWPPGIWWPGVGHGTIIGGRSWSPGSGAYPLNLSSSSSERAHPFSRDERLTAAIIGLAKQCGRYGDRCVTRLLRTDSSRVNHKRVRRIRRLEGLIVPAQQKRRGRLWLNDGSYHPATVVAPESFVNARLRAPAGAPRPGPANSDGVGLVASGMLAAKSL